MAKWGEGDQRWIVQEREDGANVNGWHWEEKQRMHWIQERIPQMLNGLQADGAQEVATIRVKEVTSIKGDACVTRRKQGKKLAVYDLNLVVSWTGKMVVADSKAVGGVIKISEYASGSDEDDWIMECSTTETGDDAEPLRALAQMHLQPLVLKALEPLSEELLATL